LRIGEHLSQWKSKKTEVSAGRGAEDNKNHHRRGLAAASLLAALIGKERKVPFGILHTRGNNFTHFTHPRRVESLYKARALRVAVVDLAFTAAASSLA
jgi:hypothetical protein